MAKVEDDKMKEERKKAEEEVEDYRSAKFFYQHFYLFKKPKHFFKIYVK